MGIGSNSVSVDDLFASAKNDEVLGADAFNALQVSDLGVKIANALGTPADQFQAGEVVLVAVKVDDSGSIRFSGNTEAIADGYNSVIDALLESKQSDNVLFHGSFLSGKVICPFVSVSQAVRLTTGPGGNFDPNSGTPLYDEAVSFWGTVLAKSQEFSDQGVPCRTISLILSDGADVHSNLQWETQYLDPNDRNTAWRAPKPGVKALANDLLRQECHILAAMGVDDNDGGTSTDFKRIFQAMGIRPEWIMHAVRAGRTKEEFKSEIRRMFQVFSQSAVRASQSTVSFSQQAVGGFGTP